MKIGVLALQGDFREHILMLKKINIEYIEVRTKEQLDKVNGLIIPGGESTTIGKLMKKYKLDIEIKKRNKKGMPIFSTCAGGILLAKEIKSYPQQFKLGLIDISVERNAYGRQLDSFEADIKIKGFKKKFPAVFIRAPIIKDIHDGIEILASHEDNPVLLKKENILIATFHPELGEDPRIHRYFIDMVK